MTKPQTKTAKAEKPEAGEKSSPAKPLPSRARARGGAKPPVAEIHASFDPAGAAARFVAVEGLIPYVRNSRTHSEAQIARLAGIIEELGWTNPILADDKGVIAGHGRLQAARLLYAKGRAIRLPSGLELPAGTVPVIDCTGWTEAQRRYAVIADNSIALDAGWDHDMLRLEFGGLGDAGLSLDLLGFDPTVLDAIMNPGAGEAEAEPEDEGDPALDEPEAPTVICCPKCQHQFSILAERKDEKPKRKKAA